MIASVPNIDCIELDGLFDGLEDSCTAYWDGWNEHALNNKAVAEDMGLSMNPCYLGPERRKGWTTALRYHSILLVAQPRTSSYYFCYRLLIPAQG